MLHNVNNLNLNTFLLLKIMENSLVFEPILVYSVGLAYFYSNFYGDYLSKSSIYYIVIKTLEAFVSNLQFRCKRIKTRWIFLDNANLDHSPTMFDPLSKFFYTSPSKCDDVPLPLGFFSKGKRGRS